MPQPNFEVLKEPRGFIRCIQIFISLFAFATLTNYSTEIVFSIWCKTLPSLPLEKVFNQFIRKVYYPFRVSDIEPIDLKSKELCDIRNWKEQNSTINFLGDFSSDAEFFVFTGVISWLYSIFSLVVYVYFPHLYHDDTKRKPKLDFALTALVSMFWLAGSAAWANGLTGLRWSVDSNNWLHKTSICRLTNSDIPHYVDTKIDKCDSTSGEYVGATCAVVLGFLNWFLWTGNLWFLFKETTWFAGKGSSTDYEANEARITASEVMKDEEAAEDAEE